MPAPSVQTQLAQALARIGIADLRIGARVDAVQDDARRPCSLEAVFAVIAARLIKNPGAANLIGLPPDRTR
ncbi:hypothetical protein UNPA324_14275 [Bradyrhizobium sp. UNPA324]|nr:hypothetical protein UNPA324_14275 [Bradyrhizobium sp. UNPA324]